MLTHFIFAMAISLASVAEHQTAQQTETQKELLHFATETQESHLHFASVWPGFWDEKTPFIVFNHEGQAVLFTKNEPIPGYQKLADNYYYYSERLPNLTDFPFHIHYPLPDHQIATTVRLNLDDESTDDHRETLLHEAFHGYQRTEFADLGRSEFLDPKYLDEASIRAMLQLQFALAKQAHESREIAHIHDWLTVRVALSKVIASEVASYLADVEHIEGTAQWVGIQGSFAEHYRDNIDSFFNHFPALFETTHALRTSAYVTGALLTDFVNDFSASDNNWRHAIEQGKTPYELALQLFSISTEEALERFNDVIAQYDFSDYMARAQATKSDQVTLADIEASYPYRLDITINVVMDDGRVELPMSFSGGDEGFHQLEVNLIFLPNAETLQLTMQGSVIDIRNAPVLADMRKVMEGEVTYSFWSQSPMTTMDALKNMKDLDLQFGQSIIQSPAGWTLGPTSTSEHLRITF
ncbi:hypothetical protein CWE09_09325 [Aliidiomarina minuta]|uniref:Uncharacterized protein n=1 Tax=Aliidiomarina minuta TaxID=880057 RepID=A0A432W9P3_9GAMM|nr:hypothetical protein [Aliidiomarina minuta]RUO26870.1 hypothetical protein CWE09_09325 [Aliidiomarina minuta]